MMRIPVERSSWLRRIDWDWFEIGGVLVPCFYDSSDKTTETRFRLTVVPFPMTDELYGNDQEIWHDDERLPENIRHGLNINDLGWIWPYGVHNRQYDSITIQVIAKGKVRDFNHFRDSVVRKLVKNA